jgi:hypothetical protein
MEYQRLGADQLAQPRVTHSLQSWHSRGSPFVLHIVMRPAFFHAGGLGVPNMM